MSLMQAKVREKMNKKIFDKSKEKIEIDSFLCVSVFFISKENEQEQTKM